MRPRSASPVSAVARRRRARSANSRLLQLSALALSFVAVSGLVVTSSRAAFVAQSDNTTNQVSAASVDLTDDDGGTAMFSNVTGLMPGTTLDRCITVTYDGTVDPLPVRLYAAGAPTGALPPYLDLTVAVGPDSPDAFGSCTGFTATSTLYTGTLAAFGTTHGSYAAGLATWDPAGTGEARTFRFRLSVQDVAAAEGLSTTFGFSWETRTG